MRINTILSYPIITVNWKIRRSSMRTLWFVKIKEFNKFFGEWGFWFCIDFASLASYITRHLPNEKPARSQTSLMISLYKDTNIRWKLMLINERNKNFVFGFVTLTNISVWKKALKKLFVLEGRLPIMYKNCKNPKIFPGTQVL